MMRWQPPGPALLFCPADRPDRYEKAAARADVVILDLEDGCPPAGRPAARRALHDVPLDPARTVVRINPAGTADHDLDLAALVGSGYGVVMLAKTESAAQIDAVGVPVIALVETPLGALRTTEIASAEGCLGLMWGAEDLLAGLGGSSSRFTDGRYRDVARHVRSTVLLAAGAFGRWAVDSIHADIDDLDGLRAAAEDAVAVGFAAVGCIHPGQVPTVRAAFTPTESEIIWSRRVLDAAMTQPGVFRLDGRMVDGPMFRHAEAVLRRAAQP